MIDKYIQKHELTNKTINERYITFGMTIGLPVLIFVFLLNSFLKGIPITIITFIIVLLAVLFTLKVVKELPPALDEITEDK